MLIDLFSILISSNIEKTCEKLDSFSVNYCLYDKLDATHTQLRYPNMHEFMVVDAQDINITDIENLAHKFHYQIKNVHEDDFTIKNLQNYKKSYLNLNYEYLVIGDVHGCIDELKILLLKKGFEIDEEGNLYKKEECQIVLLGDFIDKGNFDKVEETLNFIYQNQERILLIKGNHEEKVYRYLVGDDETLKSDKALKEKKKYYNSALLFEQREDLRNKFLELYDKMFTWLEYNYDDNFSIILTHAPCKIKYLKKMDLKAQHNMIKSKSRSKNKGVKLDDLLAYIHQEAKDNQYYHVFGHLSQANIREYKNKICIDTSAIYGNFLSAIYIKRDEFRFSSVPFEFKQKNSSQEYNTLFDF